MLEGRIEMTGRRGRRRKQLLDDLKEKRRYWKLREEALDRTMWRTRFGRGYGPVVRQTAESNEMEVTDNFTPRPLYPQERTAVPIGPQRRCGRFGDEKSMSCRE
jgi:hypothetical protein